MKLSRLDRRDFIEGMLLLGLTACGGPRAARRSLQASPPPSGDRAIGPFFARIDRLAERFAAGRLSSDHYVHLVGSELMELELEQDVLEDWSRSGPADRGVGRNGYRTIHSRPLRARRGRTGGHAKAILFFQPPHTCNPPHEHHNLMSCKRVLMGSYHVRQYERLRAVEPGVIAVRQVSELLDVNFHGPYIDMTDSRLNVHWFGAGAEPVLALNLNVENAMRPEDTFHGPREVRPFGPYFVDPTGPADADGVILARNVDRERAEEFALRPVSDFPSRLVIAQRGGQPA
jgi:hypothetical protein